VQSSSSNEAERKQFGCKKNPDGISKTFFFFTFHPLAKPFILVFLLT
jgi:hypothetical protein